MIYAYKCRTCGLEQDSTTRADSIGPCPTTLTADDQSLSCPGELTRLFSLSVAPVMQEHYNATTNSYISDNRKFDEELKRQSERVSLYQGSEARFERVDPSDKKALGVTDEGMDATNRKRQEMGLPTYKL